MNKFFLLFLGKIFSENTYTWGENLFKKVQNII